MDKISFMRRSSLRKEEKIQIGAMVLLIKILSVYLSLTFNKKYFSMSEMVNTQDLGQLEASLPICLHSALILKSINGLISFSGILKQEN